MAKITNPSDVQYLAFEGGGGKGVAYLGAVQALEEKEILPLSKKQVKGIAGSSAGAITALFLGLGWNSKRIERELFNKPQPFKGFLDLPLPGEFRKVDSTNLPDKIKVTSRFLVLSTFNLAVEPLFDSIVTLNPLIAEFYALVPELARHKALTVMSLLYDGGICPGFSVREYFTNLLRTELGGDIDALTRKSGTTITFRHFLKVKQVDLRITGVNLSKKRPVVFSAGTTPDFPVAEAVAISMNLPAVYKPILVEAKGLEGYWCDGGLLMNLPLHAFDDPTSAQLNPNVLALRLSEISPPPTLPPVYSLMQLTNDLIGSLLYPSEEGQFRIKAERDQTIDLLTPGLSTLNFAPPRSVAQGPIDNAKRLVASYFIAG